MGLTKNSYELKTKAAQAEVLAPLSSPLPCREIGVTGRVRVPELTELDFMSQHVNKACKPSVWSTAKEKEVGVRRREVGSRVGMLLPPTP